MQVAKLRETTTVERDDGQGETSIAFAGRSSPEPEGTNEEKQLSAQFENRVRKEVKRLHGET